MWYSTVTEFQEFMEAFGQMGKTLFQEEQNSREKMLYQRNVTESDKNITSSVPRPLSAYTHVSTVYIYIAILCLC